MIDTDATAADSNENEATYGVVSKFNEDKYNSDYKSNVAEDGKSDVE